MTDQDALVWGRERATPLAHEQVVGMGRRAHDLNPARREVDHEEV